MTTAKTWHDFTTKYRRELVSPMADSIMEKCATVAEASEFLKAVADRIERKVGTTLPGIAGAQPPQGALTPNQCNSFIKSLGQLRALHASHHSQIHLPKITVQELDHAAVSAAIPRSLLNSLGYDIGKVQYRNMKQDEAPTSSAVGRPSKVTNEELIKLVGGTLGKYATDSSKVVSIRKDGRKTLVCAKLLSQKIFRIWKMEPSMRKQMSFSTFRKIKRAHFPQLRRPGRKTDVCSHCRLLKRKIAPRALAEYKKRRAAIVEASPTYFNALDQDPEFAALQNAQSDEVVVRVRSYINIRNANAARDPERAGMSRATKIALHEAEARAAHKLKGHCELLEAYMWHRTSAERQRITTAKLLEDLSETEAMLHFDFKENARYPMSQEETGDEWHAQNKLSLTVFGCVVHAPGRKHTNFLLVSEILDHDSQAARLLLTQVLETVRTKPAYEWSKVKTLHLVCDCGPHFRSREGYAFFLHDLPIQFKVDEPWSKIAHQSLHLTC